MAKFPMDDDAPIPDVPPPPQAMASEDGNFKKGRFRPIFAIIALLTLIGGGAWMYFGVKSDAKRLTPQQIAREKQDIFVLPEKEQIPKWRGWAAKDDEDMVQESLIQLGYLEDEEAIKLALEALKRKNHKITGVAAQVLAHFGSPKADAGKGPLLEALKIADDSDRPQITWALVVLKEPSVFKDAMDMYRTAKLAKVQRLGGGAAFDPAVLAGLVSLDQLAEMSTDESPAVRQLVSTVLAQNAEPKWTDKLIQLVNDTDLDVAGQAANGLGKIGDEKAREPLLKKLSAADKDQRMRFLTALRDGTGGIGLALALRSVVKEPEERAWFQNEQIFAMIHEVEDPRVGDALIAWTNETNPIPHWRSEVGMRLAEVGDIRAIPFLVERMSMDPLVVYPKEKFWQHDAGGHLSKTDNQRVQAARMLADLAIIHPEAKEELLKGEAAVLKWISDKPQPHANGLRFLANIQSSEGLPMIRKWAFPDAPLPKEGAQPPFPTEFETAQSALRYLGRYKDEESFDKLKKQFERKKDKKMDITNDGLQGAGLAMLGMALRAVAYGAAQGLGEMGDKRAVKPMMELIEDETWHEEARVAACEALAWCAAPEDMKEIAKRAVKFGSDKSPKKQLIGACYAATLSLKPVPEVTGDLIDLLTPETEVGLRNYFAQAIGASPLDDANRDKLFEKMKNVETRNAAALALILGGDTSTAARTVAMYGDFGPEAMNDLKDAYFRAFGFWSDEDFTKGNLYRWVDNSLAIARVKVFDAPQLWAIERLQAQFDNLQYDNGPHSETRVVLRYRLLTAAKTGDDKVKASAIRTLKFMKEKGVLMALREEKGLTGDLAKKAFYELMNPVPVAPEDLKALQAEQAGKMKSN
jgi:HEAT repeat protein